MPSMISKTAGMGDAMTGGLALLIGPVAAIVAGGAGAILVTGLWSRLFPQIGAAKSFDPPAAVTMADLAADADAREKHAQI